MGLIIAIVVILVTLVLFAMGVVAWGASRDDIYYPLKLDYPDRAAPGDVPPKVRPLATQAEPTEERSDVRRTATGRGR